MHDSALEQPLGPGHGEERRDAHCTSRRPEHGDFPGITAEYGYVLLHPLERGDLVEETQVGDAIGKVEEAFGAHSVIYAHAHNSVAGKPELSQSRTRTLLRYVLMLPPLLQRQEWLKARLTANGLSSSKAILNQDGVENREASQRVEFRVRTNSDSRIDDILKTGLI